MSYTEKQLYSFREEFSFAYLNAICSSQGITLSKRSLDNDGIDGILTLYNKDNDRINIDFQLKTRDSGTKINKGLLSYDIKVKNHNDLCKTSNSPSIFILLEADKEIKNWANLNNNELLLRHNMYFHDYLNEIKTENINTCAINIPESNIVDPSDFKTKLIDVYNLWYTKKYGGKKDEK